MEKFLFFVLKHKQKTHNINISKYLKLKQCGDNYFVLFRLLAVRKIRRGKI